MYTCLPNYGNGKLTKTPCLFQHTLPSHVYHTVLFKKIVRFQNSFFRDTSNKKKVYDFHHSDKICD